MTDDVHALSGVYALDALPEEERVTFEAHLERCAACQREVREFRAVCADFAVLAEEPPPASLRAAVMRSVEEADAAGTIQWATRELLAARTRQDVVDTVLAVVERLGGWTVPADRSDDDALPLDVGLGSGAPLLAVAEPGSQAREQLERHLPQLVEDARATLETIRRTRRASEPVERGEDRHVGSGEPGPRSR